MDPPFESVTVQYYVRFWMEIHLLRLCRNPPRHALQTPLHKRHFTSATIKSVFSNHRTAASPWTLDTQSILKCRPSASSKKNVNVSSSYHNLSMSTGQPNKSGSIHWSMLRYILQDNMSKFPSVRYGNLSTNIKPNRVLCISEELKTAGNGLKMPMINRVFVKLNRQKRVLGLEKSVKNCGRVFKIIWNVVLSSFVEEVGHKWPAASACWDYHWSDWNFYTKFNSATENRNFFRPPASL